MTTASIQSLTARQLKSFIKNGFTPEEIQSRYACTDNELKTRIGQLYHQGSNDKAREIYKELEANRKKARKKVTEPETTTEIERTPEPNFIPGLDFDPNPGCDSDCDSEPLDVEYDEDETTPVAVPTQTPGSLERLNRRLALEADEHLLSNEVIELECEHKTLNQMHRARISNLRELQLELDRLKSDLQQCHDKYIRTVSEADEIANRMNKVSTLRREKMVALEAVRHEITELQRVSLYVFTDGRIESDDLELVLDDDGHLELKEKLVSREECLDLRVRDITTLARLLIISEKINHLTLVCENPELETAFMSIRGA